MCACGRRDACRRPYYSTVADVFLPLPDSRYSPQNQDDGRPVIIAGDDDLAALLRHLYEEHGITSLLVEGGATVHRAFIDAALWDAARVEKAPFRLGEQGGVAAPRLPAGIRPAATAEIDGRRLELFSNNSLVSCFAEM